MAKKQDKSTENPNVVTDADGNEKFKCQYCGKWISPNSFDEHGAGSYCYKLRESGWDDVRLAEHRASLTVEDVPQSDDGRDFIKVAILHKICVRNGIPVSRMVKAIGGDRSLDGPMHPTFQPFYVGRARYVHPDCGEAWGLNYLKELEGGRNSSSTPRGSGEEKEMEDALA